MKSKKFEAKASSLKKRRAPRGSFLGALVFPLIVRIDFHADGVSPAYSPV